MLNPIEEAKFKALRESCKELGVPSPPEIHINFEVKDKDGNLIFEDLQRGHSWTRNFYNFLLSHAASYSLPSVSFGAGYLSGKNTAGSLNGSALSNVIYNWINGVGAGLMVGTGDTAFGVDQYILVTPIVSGNAAGQLLYSTMSTAVAAYDSTAGSEKWTITQKRIFNNNSGGSITVKETGLYCANGTYFMLERSVLSPTVAVPNGAQLTVTYEISMSFAAID